MHHRTALKIAKWINALLRPSVILFFLVLSYGLHVFGYFDLGLVAGFVTMPMLFLLPNRERKRWLVDAEILRMLIKNSPDAVCIRQVDGTWLFANDQAVRLLGIPRFRLIGFTDKQIMTNSPNAQMLVRKIQSSDEKAWSSVGPFDEILRIRGNDEMNLSAWYEVRKVPVFGSTGERKYLLTQFSDISERYLAQQSYAQKLENLQLRERKLVEFSGSIEKFREQERTSIAMDVHDNLGHLLTSLRLTAEALERKFRESLLGKYETSELLEQFEQMLQLCDKSVTTTRKLSRKLTEGGAHDDINDTDIAAVMREEIGQITGDWLRVEFMQKIFCSISGDIQEAAITILKEALNNTVKHSHATCALVFVTTSAGGLVMTIEDNGHAPEKMEGGIGSRSMAERAERVGGAISFGTGLMGGLKICVVIPAKESEAGQPEQRALSLKARTDNTDAVSVLEFAEQP